MQNWNPFGAVREILGDLYEKQNWFCSSFQTAGTDSEFKQIFCIVKQVCQTFFLLFIVTMTMPMTITGTITIYGTSTATFTIGHSQVEEKRLKQVANYAK